MTAFSLNVAVDAIDGHVARTFREATPFGAVFDREVDAFFVLCAYLYFVVYSIGALGGWLLLAGLLPYLYRLAVAALSVPVAADNKERFAPMLAALNFTLLLAAVALPSHSTPILIVSMSVVLLSFSASFRSLHRNAHTFS